MTIGQLAAAAGVHVETVRYYQRRGLLDTPDRPLGGYRRYSNLALERLTLIRNAQNLAFTLAEVGELLAMADEEGCRKVREIAHGKLVQLGARVDEIDRIRRRLRALIRRCDRDSRGARGMTIPSLLRS